METKLMRLLLQGHLDLPQRVTLYVVLKDPHPDRIDLVDTINRLLPSRMNIDPGTLILAIVLDAV
ncbi:hypothetical protein FDQ92_06825 [Desulfoglaeba alkanexedens ALDC]|uniref:Uncharacterized protein n=1 Tax=Desulfoglaeba alkanexedens ALDC TaxID=980445 RepID=A0A4P8L2G8_9BACT|nr:hypothetical protein [Desulfoglaeba alkanexedens]QCQ21914.1 hypothetical protein FDQ92_06825 [Desulfoglaeba alkanexedens ALDC]